MKVFDIEQAKLGVPFVCYPGMRVVEFHVFEKAKLEHQLAVVTEDGFTSTYSLDGKQNGEQSLYLIGDGENLLPFGMKHMYRKDIVTRSGIKVDRIEHVILLNQLVAVINDEPQFFSVQGKFIGGDGANHPYDLFIDGSF